MITYFMQLNVKLLFVLILFGFIMGQTRHAAIQNFSNKNRSYLILDFFNLVGTPVHEIGHLLFGLIFGYKIDQICLYRTTKKALHSGGTLGFVKMHHENRSFLQKLQGDFGQFFISIVFFTICVFKDAYFSYSETPVKNIVQSIFLFSLIGGINLYTGIMNQQEIISQHSPVKFNNINLISGILLLLADAIVITRAIMEHLQKEE